MTAAVSGRLERTERNLPEPGAVPPSLLGSRPCISSDLNNSFTALVNPCVNFPREDGMEHCVNGISHHEKLYTRMNRVFVEGHHWAVMPPLLDKVFKTCFVMRL